MVIDDMQHPFTPLAWSKGAENALPRFVLDRLGGVPQKKSNHKAWSGGDREIFTVQLFVKHNAYNTSHACEYLCCLK